jgi:hypothetical protein
MEKHFGCGTSAMYLDVDDGTDDSNDLSFVALLGRSSSRVLAIA